MARTQATETPASIIAAADAELQEAQLAEAATDSAVRSGDDSITQEQLETARKATSWAQIKREAASRRAEQRAQEIAQQEYRQVLDANLPAATQDHSADIEALLAQARPFITQAIDLVRESNRSVGRLALLAGSDLGQIASDDALWGQVPNGITGAAWFSYKGKRVESVPAVFVIKNLLRPLRPEIEAGSGGMGESFLNEIG